MNYKLEHEIFKISILFKGIYSFLELLAGVILLFVTSPRIYLFIHNLFRNELLEDARDFTANFVLHLVQNLSPQMKLFISIYLIIHGAIKLILIIGLWKRKRIFYPLAIGIFGLFVIFQIYKYLVHPSLILLFLTDFDMLIIILTLIEWRNFGKNVFKKV